MMLVIGAACIATGCYAQNGRQDNATDTSSDAHPGWIELTDSVGQVIGLQEGQRDAWRTRNKEWQERYHALGEKPEESKSYIKLHSARDFDLKRWLFPDQYDRWEALNHRSRHISTANPPGTNRPPDD